jgi:putative dimethyl sulfoxide reductase chaperone
MFMSVGEAMTEREDSQEPGLRDIARWLTTPAHSGVYLSLRDLERIGHRVGVAGLPRNRRFAIEQLFRSAAVDDNLDDLLRVLRSEISAHVDAYRDCDHETLQPWIDRALLSLNRLDEMQQVSGR